MASPRAVRSLTMLAQVALTHAVLSHVALTLGVLASAALVCVASAQQTDTTRRAPGATVSGVVRDSIARAPLPGAWVQIVSADGAAVFARTVTADSLGRYAIDDVPDGRYTMGFLHPLLDSLGLEAPLREVQVSRRRAVRADLAIPSPARLRAAICRAQGAPTAGAVVVGVVRDAEDRAPVAGVAVTGDWLEFTFRRGGMDRRRARVKTSTTANGWFALCNVPAGGTIFLWAVRGTDSTDVIEQQVPGDGFLRRDLYVGASRIFVITDTTSGTDTLTVPPRRVRVGDGRVRGTVVAADGQQPIGGAQLRLADGMTARANERGEFSLSTAPLGTRVLEVQALGFHPARLPVDVVTASRPLTVVLGTSKAVLDTVRVTAAKVADRHNSGFEDRRRTGIGAYLTPRDIERRGPLFTSDIFRSVRGVKLGFSYDTLMTDMMQTLPADSMNTVDRRILMRGISGNWCLPSIYLNGMYVAELNADALDGWVSPEALAGVEVYNEVSVPPAYMRMRSACGAILIWTK